MQGGPNRKHGWPKTRKVSTAVGDKILGAHPEQKTHRRQCINADARTGLAKVIRARALVFVRDGNVHFPLSSLAAAAVGATFPSSQPFSKQTNFSRRQHRSNCSYDWVSLAHSNITFLVNARYSILHSLFSHFMKEFLPRQQLTCPGALILKENTPDTCFSSHEPNSQGGKESETHS